MCKKRNISETLLKVKTVEDKFEYIIYSFLCVLLWRRASKTINLSL
jgi:hypothetical protein